MHSKTALLAVCFASVLFTASSLKADFITIAQPTGGYLSSTKLLDFTQPDFTELGSLSGGGQTLSYDNPLFLLTVPDTWGTWGAPPAVETAHPRVGFTNGASSLTINLSSAVTTFGVEVEPDISQPESTTVDFFSGSQLVGTIGLSPDGDSGALLFAASTHTNPFTSVVIRNLTGDDFAIARQRFALPATATPEPGSLQLLGAAFVVAAVGLASRRSRIL